MARPGRRPRGRACARGRTIWPDQPAPGHRAVAQGPQLPDEGRPGAARLRRARPEPESGPRGAGPAAEGRGPGATTLRRLVHAPGPRRHGRIARTPPPAYLV